MENINLPFEPFSCGYILIPKKILTHNFNQKDSSFSYLEAFLMVLTKVNFEDTEIKIKGCALVCKRGESALSFASWAKLFKWTIGKARVFFSKMVKEKLISIQNVKYGVKLIQVINYDFLTGKRKEKSSGEKEKKSRALTKRENQFQIFWEKYHQITGLPKVDIELARIAWKRLTQKDRDMAIEKIYSYCVFVNNRDYFKNACNYLKAKSFYNEGL